MTGPSVTRGYGCGRSWCGPGRPAHWWPRASTRSWSWSVPGEPAAGRCCRSARSPTRCCTTPPARWSWYLAADRRADRRRLGHPWAADEQGEEHAEERDAGRDEDGLVEADPPEVPPCSSGWSSSSTSCCTFWSPGSCGERGCR